MAAAPQTYAFVAQAAEHLGLSTSEVMDLVDSGTLTTAGVDGIVLIDSDSLAALVELQRAGVPA